jgi:hypothetical protein
MKLERVYCAVRAASLYETNYIFHACHATIPKKKTLKIFSRRGDENFFIKLSSKQKISPVALLLSSVASCKQSIFQLFST